MTEMTSHLSVWLYLGVTWNDIYVHTAAGGKTKRTKTFFKMADTVPYVTASSINK